MKEASRWFQDYIYLVRGHTRAYLHKEPPSHYLEYVVEGRSPVILIPGIVAKWNFLENIGDKISLKGHPTYIVPKLGYNLIDIPHSAKIVREVIDKNGLQDVVIVGHSKGGLIGKYLMIHNNQDKRIKGLVAIATPFAGVPVVRTVPVKMFEEVSPESKLIKDMNNHTDVNSDIVTIYPVYDNLVWDIMNCYLPGAKNIEIKESGHHKLLFNKDLIKKVVTSINFLSEK